MRLPQKIGTAGAQGCGACAELVAPAMKVLSEAAPGTQQLPGEEQGTKFHISVIHPRISAIACLKMRIPELHICLRCKFPFRRRLPTSPLLQPQSMCSEDMIILGLQKTSPCCKILILMLQVADSCLQSSSSLLNIWSSLFIMIIIKTRTTDTTALGVPRVSAPRSHFTVLFWRSLPGDDRPQRTYSQQVWWTWHTVFPAWTHTSHGFTVHLQGLCQLYATMLNSLASWVLPVSWKE